MPKSFRENYMNNTARPGLAEFPQRRTARLGQSFRPSAKRCRRLGQRDANWEFPFFPSVECGFPSSGAGQAPTFGRSEVNLCD
jgi:hypothetical protein